MIGPAAERARRLAARARAILRDPGSLGRRVASASAWRMGETAFSQTLRLAGNLIMTRILVPEDFGVMALAMVFQTALMMLTDVGLNLSVIRSPNGDDPRFLRTVWTLKIVKQLGVAACLLATGAGLLALQGGALLPGGYADPRLPALIAALAVPAALVGLESTATALCERRLRIGSLMLIYVAAQAATLAAVVGFALGGAGVWAFVLGGTVGAALRCALTHLALPGPRMALVWDRAHAAEIWGFGKWIIGSSSFHFLAQQGDRLLFAGLLDPAAFGLYAIARVWIDGVSDLLSRVSIPVTQATFSEVARDRPEALARVFFAARAAVAAAAVAGYLGFVLGGPLFVDIAYVDAYAKVGVLMQILAPIVLIQVFRPVGTLLVSTGDSRTFARTAVIGCVALFVTVPAAFLLLGEPWAYAAVALNGLWAQTRIVRMVARIVPLQVGREIACMGAILGLGLVTTALAWR